MVYVVGGALGENGLDMRRGMLHGVCFLCFLIIYLTVPASDRFMSLGYSVAFQTLISAAYLFVVLGYTQGSSSILARSQRCSSQSRIMIR